MSSETLHSGKQQRTVIISTVPPSRTSHFESTSDGGAGTGAAVNTSQQAALFGEAVASKLRGGQMSLSLQNSMYYLVSLLFGYVDVLRWWASGWVADCSLNMSLVFLVFVVEFDELVTLVEANLEKASPSR